MSNPTPKERATEAIESAEFQCGDRNHAIAQQIEEAEKARDEHWIKQEMGVASACCNNEIKLKKLIEALEFYADPDTYFAIGFLPDRPCGEFINDGSETDLGIKPGKKARKVLDKYFKDKE